MRALSESVDIPIRKVADLVGMTARRVWIQQCTVDFNVADIEKLVILQAADASCLNVRLDVIKLAQLSAKCNMPLIIETCLREQNHAILRVTIVSTMVTMSLGMQETTDLGRSCANVGEDFITDGRREVDASDLRPKCRMKFLGPDMLE